MTRPSPEFPSDVAPPAARRHIAALPPEPRAATEAAEAGHGHASGGVSATAIASPKKSVVSKSWKIKSVVNFYKTPAECVM